jgi:ABC-type sugar transport system permease subunit
VGFMCCSPWNDKLGRQKGEVTIDHENRAMSVMLAPSIIFVFIASIIPLIYTFALSVQDYTLTNPSGALQWLGELYPALLEC